MEQFEEILMKIMDYIPSITAIISCIVSVIFAIKKCASISNVNIAKLDVTSQAMKKEVEETNGQIKELTNQCKLILSENAELKKALAESKRSYVRKANNDAKQ